LIVSTDCLIAFTDSFISIETELWSA